MSSPAAPGQSRGSVRTCVGCRERATKPELLRVVAADRGAGLEVVPDPRGRAPGRGAHLHPTPECLALAVRRRAFVRALRLAGPSVSTAALADFVAHQQVDRKWSSSS